MSAYVKTLVLMDNSVAPEASEETVWEIYAEGASRLFDLLCEVEAEFFNKAAAGTSAKTFYGNGIDMLRLPPYIGNVSITIDTIAPDAADWRAVNGYLYRLNDVVFDTDETIVVTASWGFADIPKDVQIVVQELANYLWRNRDPMFARVSDVEIEKELSPTTNAIIKKYRDKYSQSYL